MKKLALLFITFSLITIGCSENSGTPMITQISSYERPMGNMGMVNDIFISGTHLYAVCDWAGVKVFDITDKENPVYKSSFLTDVHIRSTLNSIFVLGSYAYITSSPGLLIVDISNIDSPKLVSSYSLLTDDQIYSANPYKVYVDNGYAYCSTYEGVKVIDVFDPENPVLCNGYALSGTYPGFHVYGGYIYSTSSSTLQISEATNPSGVITFNLGSLSWPERIYVSGEYAYITCGDELRAVNISDLQNIQVKDMVDITSQSEDIFVRNDFAYIAAGVAGLKIFDVSDQENLFLRGALDTEGYVKDVKVAANYAYISDSSLGFKIIDVTDRSAPDLVSSVNTNGCAREVDIDGNYAYVADGYQGLKIFDISDLSSPELVSTYNINKEAVKIHIQNNYAYIVCTSNTDCGLLIIDVADPQHPELTGEFLPYYALNNEYDLCINGRYAYMTDGHTTRIVDISDETAPTEVADLYIGGNIKIATSTDHIFLTNNTTIEVYNISTPSSPLFSRSYTIPTIEGRTVEVIEDIAISPSGEYLYIVEQVSTPESHECELHVLDVSNPGYPLSLVKLVLPSKPESVELHLKNDFAYISSTSGVEIIDIANPTDPKVVLTIPNEQYTHNIPRVDVEGDYIYMVNAYAKEMLKIFKFQ